MNCETGVNGDDNGPEEITVWSKMMGIVTRHWKLKVIMILTGRRYNSKISEIKGYCTSWIHTKRHRRKITILWMMKNGQLTISRLVL